MTNILAINLGSFTEQEDVLRAYPEIFEGREDALQGYPYPVEDDVLAFRIAPGVIFVTVDGDADRYLLIRPE